MQNDECLVALQVQERAETNNTTYAVLFVHILPPLASKQEMLGKSSKMIYEKGGVFDVNYFKYFCRARVCSQTPPVDVLRFIILLVEFSGFHPLRTFRFGNGCLITTKGCGEVILAHQSSFVYFPQTFQ